MNIVIEGYRNIEKLNYNIDRGKINMLFGVSGSGKSSISMAICNEELEFNKKVDYFGNPEVLIDGVKVDRTSVMVYDPSSVNKYLNVEEDGSVFSILIDNENDIAREQKKFDDYMNRFKRKLDQYSGHYQELKSLSETFVGSLTSKNELRKSSKILQLESSLKLRKNTRIIKEINAIESNRLNWIVQGERLINNNVCPFCLKRMNKRRISKITQFANLDLKNLKLVKDKSSSFKHIGVTKPTFSELGIRKLSNELRKAAIAVQEFENLSNIIENIDNEKETLNLAKGYHNY